MPNNSNLSANTQAQYVNDVQAQLINVLLSKADAAAIYATNASVTSTDADVTVNTADITTLDTTSTNLSSAIGPLAPAGQRDLWQYGTGALGVAMIYAPDQDKVYTSQSAAGIAQYSADGGVTFSPCVFDVVSAGFITIGANASVVVALSSTGDAYTSSDGINFTQRAAAPAGVDSFTIEWFASAGLFVAGATADATHHIITSPDGLVWTPRLSNIIANGCIKSNSSLIVASGSTTPFIQTSVDGIVWINTAIATANSRALAWSEEKGEWLSSALATSHLYSSPDGLNWTNLGAKTPQLVGDSLMWVADGHNRWYASAPDVDGNYSLWSSPDSAIAFVGTHLDGSASNTLEYSLAYDASRDRFMIGANNSPFFAYSTPRPLDVKALSDNIRARGLPVRTSKYSATADFAIASTAVETTVAPATAIGSLVFQDAQAVGTRIDVDLVLLNTSAAGDTLTLRFKTQAGVKLTLPIVVAGGATDLYTHVTASFITRTATLIASGEVTQSGIAATGAYSSTAHSPTITNTLSVTAQWGLALSTCTVVAFNVETSFLNGA